MNDRRQDQPEATRAAAANWVVRLCATSTSGAASEAEWLAFEAWLTATPNSRAAYDAALALWLLADRWEAEGIDLNRRNAARPWIRGDARGRGAPRFGPAATLVVGAAMAAALAFVLLAPGAQRASSPAAPPATLYAAAKGERRVILLADGTRLELSGGSRVAVSLDADARRVTMSDGEAAFAVAHDPRRPFIVTVGDRQVRDLGTEFDIRRAGALIDVTVRRGRVEVAGEGAGAGAPVTLGAGRELLHAMGTDVTTVRSISADVRIMPRPSRSHCTTAPPTNTPPSSA